MIWIRLLPLSLPAADDRADRLANRPGLEANREPLARSLRANMSYTGADGREHVYLGDYDSYLWLRHARNYLRAGTPCDEVVRGVCRDTYTNAPVGARTTYARSLHVLAIAGMHRVITRFRSDYPLPASAFWVPVVVGAFGVPPAFFIAWRLAGAAAAPLGAAVAGAFAVVLTALNPVVLGRSIGSDNDVWNVVLPLYLLWAIIEALTADGPRRALFAALAAICAGFQAWAWRGWLFSYVVVVVGLGGHMLLCAARHAIAHRTLRVWRATELGRTGLVLAVFYVLSGLGAAIVGSEDPYVTTPFKAAGEILSSLLGVGARASGPDDIWPSALTMVTELAPLRLRAIASAMGGAPVVLAAILGLVLMLLSRERWGWPHRAVLIGGAALCGYGLVAGDPGRLVTIALLGAPLAAALLVGWGEGDPEASAIVLIVWFLAALHAAFDGNRFLLLLAPPLGIACAIAIGRVITWLSRLADGASAARRVTLHAVLVCVSIVALLYPLRWGYAAARSYTPAIHDAWWDTLTRIRDTTQPDAIVSAWWDYGHWIKYVAERPASNDGSSLLTHVPHWIARALLAPTERESVGLLRMLDCGSDVTAPAERGRGAYGKLRDAGRDPLTAYAIVVDLATLDDADAEAYLARGGFTPAESAGIRRSTHCEPPEGYLILTNHLVRGRGQWTGFGLWDPRHGAATSADAPFLPQWSPCRPAREPSRMVCELRATTEGADTLDVFVYDPAAPQEGQLEGGQRHGPPGAIVMAGAQRMQTVTSPSPAYPELGVLIDLPGNRVMIGAPFFLESTLVHLLYLDGRYAIHYTKFDDRADLGERVVTWKIDWDGR